MPNHSVSRVEADEFNFNDSVCIAGDPTVYSFLRYDASTGHHVLRRPRADGYGFEVVSTESMPYHYRSATMVPPPMVASAIDESAELIAAKCNEMRDFLLEKNTAYGDSALNPIRIFSSADSVEQIRVRIDDKISRMKNRGSYPGDDNVKDLCGYLIMLMIAESK